MNNLIRNSRRLANLLRHSDMPNHRGWVTVDAALNKLELSLHDIQRIVYEDSNGRFEFSDDKNLVRALYGHSINVDLGLEPTIPPKILFHGTAEKYLSYIMKEGLIPRNRNFVHLCESADMAMQVGARHGNPVVLSIDTETMPSAGYKFYKAQNGIWLTKEIPTQFLILRE